MKAMFFVPAGTSLLAATTFALSAAAATGGVPASHTSGIQRGTAIASFRIEERKPALKNAPIVVIPPALDAIEERLLFIADAGNSSAT